MPRISYNRLIYAEAGKDGTMNIFSKRIKEGAVKTRTILSLTKGEFRLLALSLPIIRRDMEREKTVFGSGKGSTRVKKSISDKQMKRESSEKSGGHSVFGSKTIPPSIEKSTPHRKIMLLEKRMAGESIGEVNSTPTALTQEIGEWTLTPTIDWTHWTYVSDLRHKQ